MPDRLLLVSAPAELTKGLLERAEKFHALEAVNLGKERGKDLVRLQIYAPEEGQQDLIDALQAHMSRHKEARITILAVEATIPPYEPSEEEQASRKSRRTTQSREELYADVSSQARPGRDYFLFIALSTVVAIAGLVEGSAAVVIGGMLIAPMLGPILAFTLGVALGDSKLMLRASISTLLGILLILALCLPVGFLWPWQLASPEILSRTRVGFDGMAIALASGAAAALALTRGASETLVGVMVAVALLPPTATLGLMLGAGELPQALGAAGLLAVNIVSINIAAQVVFVVRGVTPRTWYAKTRARRSSWINAGVWLVLFVALIVFLAVKLMRSA